MANEPISKYWWIWSHCPYYGSYLHQWRSLRPQYNFTILKGLEARGEILILGGRLLLCIMPRSEANKLASRPHLDRSVDFISGRSFKNLHNSYDRKISVPSRFTCLCSFSMSLKINKIWERKISLGDPVATRFVAFGESSSMQCNFLFIFHVTVVLGQLYSD